MKNKLFGKNIVPDCAYCDNAVFENAKCRAFDYNPLLRVPRSVTLRGTYTIEDFKL